MAIHPSGPKDPFSPEKTQELSDLREFMAGHVRRDAETLYGLGPKHHAYLEMVIDRWFDDSKNYDGRWGLLDSRLQNVGKVLDMASGCGTFVLNGLRSGRDVWGIEPEAWKLEYFQRKLDLLGLPSAMSCRVVNAFGERLPFEDETFDVATSYQTIEHVTDVAACLGELFRILKTGGVMHICAPDYRSFFEPHYLVPFLPSMNKRLASTYLSLLGRPKRGLEHLNWVTERSVLALLHRSSYKYRFERLAASGERTIREKILRRLPPWLHKEAIVTGVRALQKMRQSLSTLLRSGLIDGSIDLWIVKG